MGLEVSLFMIMMICKALQSQKVKLLVDMWSQANASYLINSDTARFFHYTEILNKNVAMEKDNVVLLILLSDLID